MKKVNYSNVYNGYNNVYRVLAYGYSVPEVKKKLMHISIKCHFRQFWM